MTTTPPDIIRLAREARFEHFDKFPADYQGKIELLVELAVSTERAARQAAQAENAYLKGRLARSGVELRQAVMDEREECAKLCDERANGENDAQWCADGIRARGTQ